MKTTSRRRLLTLAGAGGAAVGLGGLLKPEAASLAAGGAEPQHRHTALSGPLAAATMTFGQWRTSPPLNRFPNAPGAPNLITHNIQPNEVTIRAGGSVSFLIGGLHVVAVYDDGTQPASINTGILTATTGIPPGVPVIDDANNRIYMGPDGSLLSSDRVETIHFETPGRFLVICAILPHFLDNMFGFVRVLP